MEAARFNQGDVVRVEDEGLINNRTTQQHKVWRVVEEDTNKSITNDHEPAYKLDRFRQSVGTEIRYAYQSMMILIAPAILNGDGG